MISRPSFRNKGLAVAIAGNDEAMIVPAPFAEDMVVA